MTKKSEVLTFIILLFLAVSCLVFAGTHDPWDGTKWDVASPDIDQPHGNAYKEIYDLRKGIALRMNKEHETLATSSAGGVHKQGSARAFFQDAAPATQVNGDAFDSGDLGSLWFDSNSDPDNQFNVLTATTPTWTPISTEVIAVLLASNRQFAGNLTVDGTSTLTGAVTANGGITLGAGVDLIGSSTSDITINTNKFTVAGATGNTVVAGTLGVTGVATLGDTSALATSGAPTADAQIANKKYADDAIKGDVYTNKDSDNNTMLKSHAYLAQTTGFVTVKQSAGDNAVVYCYVGTTDDPAGDVGLNSIEVGQFNGVSYDESFQFFVPNGKYFEVVQSTYTPTIYWAPLCSGGANPIDQD